MKNPHHNHILRRAVMAAALTLAAGAAMTPAAIAATTAPAAAASAKPLTDWPHITSAIKTDKAMEARIA